MVSARTKQSGRIAYTYTHHARTKSFAVVVVCALILHRADCVCAVAAMTTVTAARIVHIGGQTRRRRACERQCRKLPFVHLHITIICICIY